MRRYLSRDIVINAAIAALAPVCLILAWATGYWTVGAGGAVTALCLLGVRNPPKWACAAGKPAVGGEAAPVRERQSRGHGKAQGTLAQQMICQGRAALLLRPQIAASLSSGDQTAAQEALNEEMAIVPQGAVAMRARSFELDEEDAQRGERLVQVDGFLLDRYPVTNSQYQEFVDGGGYEQMSLWDESIWPAVLGFVDLTGQPGPRFWQNGQYSADKADHPVVGVSWYEAAAFSRWAGKRLPTDAEWVKAGSWPVSTDAPRPVQRKFPWGDAMDRKIVHLWGSGREDTVPVTASPGSASVGGVEQLIGNVWEWTSSTFGTWEPPGRKIETYAPLKSIRGGAFDTYFDAQAHCQFQSGESPLSRKHNIGFRCSLGFCDVIATAEAAAPEENAPALQHEEVLA